MTKMVTTFVDVLVERDLRNGAIVGASLAAPYDRGEKLPGNLDALAFDREFNRAQVRNFTRRERMQMLLRRLGFISAAACLTLTTGLLVGTIIPA